MSRRFGRPLKWIAWCTGAALVGIAAWFVTREMHTSRLQAHYLADIDRKVSYHVANGTSDSIRFPTHGGPYDLRMGYSRMPDFTARLEARGFAITSQARDSAMMNSLADRGLFVPYPEKDQAGLRLFDYAGTPLYTTEYPGHIYSSIAAVPPVLADALSFIEDRNLLDTSEPDRNPAIDWGRFTLAALEHVALPFFHDRGLPGGSTLATQIEKFRHSPGGRTINASEKFRQMASASLAAYLGGESTQQARGTILVHYLNTEPLAAQPGDGEIAGLGDGLAAWYGRDFSEVNRLLGAVRSSDDGHPDGGSGTSAAQALAFKQALSLVIAQRAPSYYLVQDNGALERLTDSYVRLLAANGVIPPSLRDAALAQPLRVLHATPQAASLSFVKLKAVSLLRAQLMDTLGIATPYDLDRLDLTAHATIDNAIEQIVSARLARVQTVQGAKDAGLYGFEMLRPGDDPSKISFSFTLYERGHGENLLRVQTDSLNERFDVNSGGRLNLGSTAKLRTVVLYLQMISELHARYAGMSRGELARVKPDPLDALTRWSVDYLAHAQDRSLAPMLQAAVQRTYSANPGEVFYTGGGEQTFSNFEPEDNGRVLTVHEAFQRSVNLVFVRLMRDIVHHEMVLQAGPSDRWLADPALRQKYLTRFADAESVVFLHRFEDKYRGLTADQALAKLEAGIPKSPMRMAAALRSVNPEAPLSWFERQMRVALKGTPAAGMSTADMSRFYEQYGPDAFDYNDRAFLARTHPVELWLVGYLGSHEKPTDAELRSASHDVRIASYSWLFKTRNHITQDKRIRELIERDAYGPILQSWRAVGYPFATMTPSYGAAVGAAGDRPAALAKLMGIIADNGTAMHTTNLKTLTFAAGTPYETRFEHVASGGKPMLDPALVSVVHGLLNDVVQGGTGKRLAGGLPLGGGRTLPVFGKTGTGDQRLNIYAKGARLIESRKVNRTATFVYMLGDRFYGTLTAYTHEPYAARYTYTSAMAVQLLVSLGPSLAPLLDGAQ